MPGSYQAGHRGAQPLLRSGRGNPASPVARVESWPIPTSPCNVAACDCISQYLAMRNTCAHVAICDTPPWDDSNSAMLKDLAAGPCAGGLSPGAGLMAKK